MNRAIMILKSLNINLPYLRIVSCVLASLGLFPTEVWGQENPNVRASVSFIHDIAPILNKKCVVCHGPEKSKGEYRVDTFERLMTPGESKAAPISQGEPANSKLFTLLTTSDPDDRMPQKDDPLPAAQISLIKRWIEEGATFDGSNPKASLASLVPRAPHPNPPDVYPFPVPVRALAYAPDGAELAVGGYHEVTFWHAGDGRLVRRVRDLPERIYSLSFNTNGTLLAVAGGTPGQSGELALVDTRENRVQRVLGTMPDVALTTAFSPDNTRLAVAGADAVIRVFDLATGREELVIQQHADWVMSVAFDATGAQLVSASRDRSVRVFHARTGELEATYLDHAAPVFAAVFSADDKQVFSTGRDRKVHAWKIADGKKAGEMTGFDDEVLQLLAHDAWIFAGSADRQIRQFTSENRKLVRSLSGHSDRVCSLAAHAPTDRLASGAHDGEVRLWNLQTGALIRSFKAAPGGIGAEKSN